MLAKLMIAALCITSSLVALAACQSASSGDGAPVLFDDFSYGSVDDLARNGWIVRKAPGWPGVVGATWADGVSFIDDAAQPGNRLVRMTAATNGAATSQAQFCHERKYYEGTYAARVRFSDGPVSGPDGDQVVETFYAISPQKAPLDPDYSELDFEYLPNGGWGGGELALYATTWETFRLEPWLPVNVHDRRYGSLEGWHTLVLHVANREARYFLDGKLIATHGEPHYPEERMSINFNLWFIRDGLIQSSEPRTYNQDIDWVFHRPDVVLTPAEVEREIAALRANAVRFRDTVPDMTPPLPSPCNF